MANANSIVENAMRNCVARKRLSDLTGFLSVLQEEHIISKPSLDHLPNIRWFGQPAVAKSLPIEKRLVDFIDCLRQLST
ncbi:MAG: hypothetical protein JMN25_17750 [gamma proteobacterium endosymbiont of Lamellibrachia anaximandri]|nr:hypothetical protein [gamma proteobacterium endosymbiont of Lamellibrachia anaximandri]